MPVAVAASVPLLEVPPPFRINVEPAATFTAPVLLKVVSTDVLPVFLLYVPPLTKLDAPPPSALLNTPVVVSLKTPPLAFVNEPLVPERRLPADQATVPLFEIECWLKS